MIIGGDFNAVAENLVACGWLSLVRGVVHAPASATCNGKRYDYFITSSSTASAVVGVRVVGDAGTSPHSLVRLLLRANPRNHKVRCLAAPRKCGAHLPAGCAPRPPLYAEVVRTEESPSATLDNLENLYSRRINLFEEELTGVCGLESGIEVP